jgi:hypothetical protein
MGFGDDVTNYVWNWLVFIKQSAIIGGCFAAGGWGLLFDDDDGAMMLWCYELANGAMVTYPAKWVSSYSTEE